MVLGVLSLSCIVISLAADYASCKIEGKSISEALEAAAELFIGLALYFMLIYLFVVLVIQR